MTNDKPASEQIDDIIQSHKGWKGDVLSQVRATILATDPSILEEVKWKTPSRPLGLPCWSSNGLICFAEIWKDNVKLLFTKGARLKDPHGAFNARLKSADIRAVEYKEGDTVNQEALKALVTEAVDINAS